MEKVTVFDPKSELRKLEEKIARSAKEEVCISWLLVPKAACKEAKWDGNVLVEEAITRGKERKEGKDVGEASWEDLDTARELRIASEIQGREATEEDGESSGRLSSMRINLLPGESRLEKKVSEERLEVTEVEISRPQDYEQVWDCPRCEQTNHVSEFDCPSCSFDRGAVEEAVIDWYNKMDRSSYTPRDHVAHLNSIVMLKTGNPNWYGFVNSYMKQYNLKPEDMEGLRGPKPWEEKMGNELHEKQESHEKKATNEQLTAALIEQKVDKEEDPLTALQKSLMTMGDQKEHSAKASLVDIKSAFEEKAAEVADTDSRTRVIVSDEIGWLCADCNRVWSLEHEKCSVCNKEYAETLKQKKEMTMAEQAAEALKEKAASATEGEEKNLYTEVKTMEGMKSNEKARLMLLLKAKEIEAKTKGAEDALAE